MTPEQIQFRILAKAGDLEHARVGFEHRMCLPYEEKRGIGRRLGGRLRPRGESRGNARRAISGARDLAPPKPGQKPIDGDGDGLIFDDTSAEQPAVARAVAGVARAVAGAARGLQQAREEDRDLIAEGLDAAARGIRRITGQATDDDRNRAREAVEDVARAVPETPERDRVRSARKPKPPKPPKPNQLERDRNRLATRRKLMEFFGGQLPPHLRRIQFTESERAMFGDNYTPANVLDALGRRLNAHVMGERGPLDDTEKRLALALANHMDQLVQEVMNLPPEDRGQNLQALRATRMLRALERIRAGVRHDNPFDWDNADGRDDLPEIEVDLPTPPRPNLTGVRRQQAFNDLVGVWQAKMMEDLGRNIRLNGFEFTDEERRLFGEPTFSNIISVLKRRAERELFNMNRDDERGNEVRIAEAALDFYKKWEENFKNANLRKEELEVAMQLVRPAIEQAEEYLRDHRMFSGPKTPDTPFAPDAGMPEFERAPVIDRVMRDVQRSVRDGKYNPNTVASARIDLENRLEYLRNVALDYKAAGRFNDAAFEEYQQAIKEVQNAILNLREIQDGGHEALFDPADLDFDPVSRLEGQGEFHMEALEAAIAGDDADAIEEAISAANNWKSRLDDFNITRDRLVSARITGRRSTFQFAGRNQRDGVKRPIERAEDKARQLRVAELDNADNAGVFAGVQQIVTNIRARRQKVLDDYVTARYGRRRPWAAPEFNIEELRRLTQMVANGRGTPEEREAADKTLRKWARGAFSLPEFTGKNGIKFKTSVRTTIKSNGLGISGTISAFNPNTQKWEKVGKFKRNVNFNADDPHVYNDLMVIGKDYSQASRWAREATNNSGFTSIFNPHAFMWYKAAGIKRVGVTAGYTDGPYVWGRMGFRPSNVNAYQKYERFWDAEIRKFEQTGESGIIKNATQLAQVKALWARQMKLKEQLSPRDYAKMSPYLLEYSVIFDPVGGDVDVKRFFLNNGLGSPGGDFDLDQLPER